MWALKQLYDKGLLYEGQRVLPYCWECETPLSNFETRLDDAYRHRQDPALTVWFELETGRPSGSLVWTTTPWTLPSNLALAVGPDIDYAVFEEDGQRYVLGEATVEKYAKELEGAERVGTVKGAELVGRRYPPLFPYFAEHRERLRGARPPTGSPPRRAPASSTSPPASARTTRRLRRGRHPAIVPGRRARPVHRRGPRLPGRPGLRRQRRRSSATSRTRASWCATRPTTTPTRTAGAPTRRSSTGPCRAGS